MTPFTRRLASAAACAALALPVFAQTTAPSAPAAAVAPTAAAVAQHRAEREAKRQQWQEKRAERRAERRAEHLAKFKQSLALAPAQESAWTTYTESLQPREKFARLDHSGMEQLTTPERIDRMRAIRAQRSAAMDARMDATKAFYAQLQPEQQKTFDRESARMWKMKGAHGHQRGGHGHEGRRGAHGAHHGAPAAPAAPAAGHNPA